MFIENLNELEKYHYFGLWTGQETSLRNMSFSWSKCNLSSFPSAECRFISRIGAGHLAGKIPSASFFFFSAVPAHMLTKLKPKIDLYLKQIPI